MENIGGEMDLGFRVLMGVLWMTVTPLLKDMEEEKDLRHVSLLKFRKFMYVGFVNSPKAIL